MKILVVAALHGDEVFGLKVAGKLQENPTPKNEIVVRIGNPEAIAKRRRYIEEDLNRSFLSTKPTIESRLARNLRYSIDQLAPDLLVDIHTSTTTVGRVAIAAQNSPLVGHAAAALGADLLVVMPKAIAATSLIGCLPEKSLSIEFGRPNRSDKLAADLARRITDFQPNSNAALTLPIYEVFDQIDKHYSGLANIKNLEYNSDLGGYPFLAGPNTYKDSGGFLARKVN